MDKKTTTYLYFYPTLFTALNMLCGIYSIISAINSKFIKASLLIFAGIIFDGIDGLISRSKKIESFLGTELDTLADFTTFCVAPMVLVWQLVMYKFEFAGVVVCFLYIFFGAIRLARFNISVYNKMNTTVPQTFIEGLPTPAAAGFVTSTVLLLGIATGEFMLSKKHMTLLFTIMPAILNFLPGIIMILAVLMVTKLRYPKINNIKLTQKMSLRLFTILFVAVLLIFSYPESSIFLIFSFYILWGLIEYLVRIYKMRRQRYLSEK